jgi:hypothetical protein
VKGKRQKAKGKRKMEKITKGKKRFYKPKELREHICDGGINI